MPSRILPSQVLRSMQSVKYSTQTATKANPSSVASLPKRQPRITKLPNGITVASVDNYSPVSRVSLSFKAGSRYEDGGSSGVTHALRTCAGLGTKDISIIGMPRNVLQVGGSLTTSATREYLNYNLECNRDNAEFAMTFLNAAALKQVFKPWEVQDNVLPRMKLDLAVVKEQPHLVVLEQLHKAAFRSGLGNSLYSPAYLIGDHEPEMLLEYIRTHFTTNRLALVGVGICHDYLVEYASKALQLNSGEGPASTATKYGGGEIRVETGGPLSYVAVATEGASLKNPKEALALGVLQHVLGTGNHVKWSEGSAANKLSQVAAKASDKPFAITALNINYSDSGLFGFYCVAQQEEIGKVLQAVFGQYSALTKGGISDADVQRAKHQLKAFIALAIESPAQLLEEFSVQAHCAGQLTSLEDTFTAIDSITANDVTTIAKKVINGKPSMAAVGNLSQTPYLDQLT